MSSRLLQSVAVVLAVRLMLMAEVAHGDTPQNPSDVVSGVWTLILLPDTQIYSEQYPGLFALQTRWIAKNRDKYGIRYVFHLGDITNGNTVTEWRHAQEAMSELDGTVPYVVVTGNHDYSDFSLRATSGTLLNQYFPLSTFKPWPTFGGTMNRDDACNTYHLFSAGGIDWIVIALEWDPHDDALQWADEVLAKYPQRKAILVTHAYLYADKTRCDPENKKKGSREWTPHTGEDSPFRNDGEDLWQKFVRKNDFAFVFSGHVTGAECGFLSSKNDRGKTTHQMYVDYQMRKLGGEGYLRMIEFLPDGKTVHVKSYSPLYDKYLQDAANQFSFDLEDK
jgi:hypothetical protein